MGSKYKLDDTVLARIVQIIQESMMMATDCTDNLRSMVLEHAPLDEFGCNSGKLVLAQEYLDAVNKEYEVLVNRAEELKTSHHPV